jgi:hypothetical protein
MNSMTARSAACAGTYLQGQTVPENFSALLQQ